MNKRLVISLFEAIYIIYMLNYFETTLNLSTAHCLTDIYYHPTSDALESKVCKFGNIISWPFAAYLLLRNIKFNKTLNYIVLTIGATLSLMNYNVIAYLIPIVAVELLLVH